MKITRSKKAIIVESKLWSRRVLLDPRKRLREDDLVVTTHGHGDHMPSSNLYGEVICSDITGKMILFYKPKSKIECTERYEDNDILITLHDAGHSLGSRMMLLEDKHNGEKLLYTGDYNTLSKYCGKAEPIDCDLLIVDSTYGNKRFRFPRYEEEIHRMLGYIRKYIKEEIPLIINTYSFGKPQEICSILQDNRIGFSVDNKIKQVNQQIDCNFSMEGRNSNIFITRRLQRTKDKQKIIAVSGHAMSPFLYKMRDIDESFVISDHADYPSGIEFVRDCNPRRVFTVFGHENDFARSIREELNAESLPLMPNQSILDDFW